MAVIRSLCGQCAVGCGIRAVTGEGRDASFTGDAVHPANGGALCPKSEALNAMFGTEGRLLHPLIGGREAGWERAMAQAARRLSATIERHGPGSIALHVSGGLLTEDYYVANKLMKGFIGSAHIHAPWSGSGVIRAHRSALGEDVMPAACEDIDRAEQIVLVGASLARQHPVLVERVLAAREERGARLILIARGDEGEGVDADMRLSIQPGSEAALFSGLLLHCHEGGALDEAFMNGAVHVPYGFWEDLRAGHDLWSVARRCGASPADIRGFYDAFSSACDGVTLFGEDAALAAGAILNLHLATGRMGRPGATPFAVAGWPNAMGGREIGCHADELAVHRSYSPDAIAETARFWGAERMACEPGLDGKALADAVGDGRIKALILLGGLPSEGDVLHGAFAQAPFAVVTTPWHAQEVQSSQVVALPSPPWVEKDGTVTGADRLVSRQRHIFPLAGQARPDWWIVTQIARAMGWHDAFHYERPAEIYREHVRLTAYRNEGGRLLNLKRHAPISNPAYDELTPWRWGETPFDGGGFPTEDGRARLVPSRP